MSTTASTLRSGRPEVASGGATFPNVLRSEWAKLWTVRSTMWSLLATFVVTVGLTALIAWGITANWDQASAEDRATFDPTSNSLNGLLFGQLAIAVLGVLTISGEYSTGGVKATFTAVPRRLQVLAAKAITVAVVTLVVGLLTCFASFFVGQAFFATQHVSASLGDPGVTRAVVGGGLYLAGSAMFGFACGTLLRHTAGAITGVVALLFVLPLLSNALPGSWGHDIQKYFTTNAGQHITDVRHVADALSPWPGYLVFTLEWLVVLLVGAVLLRRRDA